MTTIYKYPIEVAREQRIDMPDTRKFLHAGLDGAGNPCIWALVTIAGKVSPAHIRVVGTGLHIGPEFYGMTHIGTFNQGPFIWHVFA